MKKSILIPIIAVLAMSLLPAAARAGMDLLGDRISISSSAELGAQFHDTIGVRTSQFEAYRDLPEGFVFEEFHFLGEYNEPAMPYYLRFDGRDIAQDDQNLFLEFGRYGNFRLSFEWEESPRLYSTGVRTLYGNNGNGRMMIADATQAALEGTAFTVFDPNNASLYRTTLADFVNNAGQTELRVDRQRGTVDYLQKLAPGLNMRVKYVHENKEGNKLTSVGAYQRPTFDAGALLTVSGEGGERWRLTLVEVPEPIDYGSDMVTFGLEMARDDWSASLEYNFQQFSNNISVLSFDNPYNLVPDDATGVSSLRGISTALFVQDLPPDWISHSGTLSACVDLPMRSRLNATASVGGTWQDDPFVPFSANPAMTVGVPGGDATSRAILPRNSLDGTVLTIVQNYVLTSRPVDPLKLTARYRYYYYDNETDEMTMPGYAELIDAQWHGPGFNGPKMPSYLRQNGALEAEYDISPTLSARADYGWERWRRWERNVRSTDEHKVGGGLTARPAGWVRVMVDYHWSNRDGSEDYTPTTFGTSTEAASSKFFDQADRSRHDVTMRVSLMPLDNLDLTATGSYLEDSYNIPALGLDRAYTWVAAADASYSPIEALTLMANYTHEDARSHINGGSKTTAVGGVIVGSPTFASANYYNTKFTDKVDSFGVGLNGVAVPDSLEFGTYYNYTRGKGKLHTFNPNPRTTADSINSSQALPYSDIKSVTQEVSAEVVYRFLKRFAVNLKYTYENFEIDDYAWKDMGNQIGQVIQDGVPVQDTQRVLLLDSQYGDYQAHVGTVTLSYNF